MSSDTCPLFNKCPRCGEMAYETFSTHDCCHECNYSTDYDYSIDHMAVPKWAIDAAKEAELEEALDEENQQDETEAA